MSLNFWRGKRVFLTGHTGFKGSWLSCVLIGAGAELTGYSLQPPTKPNLFTICGIEDKMTSIIGDVRDKDKLFNSFEKACPEIIFHMAAQPIVRDSYEDPAYTYETNVMGTVNLLECIRLFEGAKSFLNVTSDKVYHNNEWEWGYRETDTLGGFDPYSNSKSCSELVTQCYRSSFFADSEIAISTVRAGNVIGGGDFANYRIIPDCVRAAMKQEDIIVRNPYSTRPYQHVLDPLFAYLMIAQKQYEDTSFEGYYNVGPDDDDCVSTEALVELFCSLWGKGQLWKAAHSSGPHEASFLRLDCSKLKSVFNWVPVWGIRTAVEKTVEWTEAWLGNENVFDVMNTQINMFLEAGGVGAV